MSGAGIPDRARARDDSRKIAAAVVITTMNRRDDLRQAIASCLAQDAPLEILVLDDGSTDGTAAMVRQEFPSVRIERRESSGGYICRRNEAAALVEAPIIFSIDDDAKFSAPDVVRQTVLDFELSDRIGAVAIPCIDVNRSPYVRQPFPNDQTPYITSEYIGTAHAIRRELFLRLGGYRENLVHQGEERDYCIRMLDAGYVVRLGTAAPILHYESPRRDTRRMDHYGRRNDVLFAFDNVPRSRLLPHLAGTTLNGLRFGVRSGHPGRAAIGLLAGYRDGIRTGRSPRVSVSTYQLFRRLRRSGFLPLDEAMAAFGCGSKTL